MGDVPGAEIPHFLEPPLPPSQGLETAVPIIPSASAEIEAQKTASPFSSPQCSPESTPPLPPKLQPFNNSIQREERTKVSPPDNSDPGPRGQPTEQEGSPVSTEPYNILPLPPRVKLPRAPISGRRRDGPVWYVNVKVMTPFPNPPPIPPRSPILDSKREKVRRKFVEYENMSLNPEHQLPKKSIPSGPSRWRDNAKSTPGLHLYLPETEVCLSYFK